MATARSSSRGVHDDDDGALKMAGACATTATARSSSRGAHDDGDGALKSRGAHDDSDGALKQKGRARRQRRRVKEGRGTRTTATAR